VGSVIGELMGNAIIALSPLNEAPAESTVTARTLRPDRGF
jgi:hypothetical protein